MSSWPGELVALTKLNSPFQVIIDSQPLTVAILASLLFGESIGAVGVGGLVLGVVGLLLLEVCLLLMLSSNFSYAVAVDMLAILRLNIDYSDKSLIVHTIFSPSSSAYFQHLKTKIHAYIYALYFAIFWTTP